MNSIITVEHISKRYRLGSIDRQTFGDELAYRWLKLRGKNPVDHMGSVGVDRRSAGDFWALDDVSFSVEAGEVVGLIGKNGAGKSTILKILSRITGPTSGRAVLKGRVGSLLEVGTGFHPELTGRENVFMNGTILGMRRREIAAKFDEIVAFSAVDKFLDTPVKRYSSGMYVRLAFAVAAHLDTEILLVDEVLAVGDVEFQNKCLGKMGEVAKQGRTVLFVSHNMPAVKSLCGRCIWFQDGQIHKVGGSDTLVDEYVDSSQEDPQNILLHARQDRKGRGSVVVDDLKLTFDETSQSWTAHATYHSAHPSLHQAAWVLNINSLAGETVTSLDSRCIPGIPEDWAGSGAIEIRLAPEISFAHGEYSCDFSLFAENELEDQVSNAYVFKVGTQAPFDWKAPPHSKAGVSIRQDWLFHPSTQP